MNKENNISKLPSKLPQAPPSRRISSTFNAINAVINNSGTAATSLTRVTRQTISSKSKSIVSKPSSRPIAKIATTLQKPRAGAKPVVPARSVSKPITTKPVVLKPVVSRSVAAASSSQPPLKRKRKEYDVKGRLQDLEENHNEVTGKLEESTVLIGDMRYLAKYLKFYFKYLNFYHYLN